MSESSYTLEIEKPADKKKIIPFLELNYNRHEPLLLMYLAKHVEQISPAHRHGIASYLYKSHELTLTFSTCFTLHHRENDEIVAAMLIHVEENPSLEEKNPEVVDAWRSVNDENAVLLYETLKHLPSNSPLVNDVFRTIKFPALEEAKIFMRYPHAKKAANIMLLCVGEEHRGKGLANLLIEKAVDWAKTSEIDVLYGLFTSEFAQKAAEKSELKRISRDMDLMSYKNELGKPIFEGMEPRCISIMARQM